MNFGVKGDDRPLNQFGVFECKENLMVSWILRAQGAMPQKLYKKHSQVSFNGSNTLRTQKQFFPPCDNLFSSMLAFNNIEAARPSQFLESCLYTSVPSRKEVGRQKK